MQYNYRKFIKNKCEKCGISDKRVLCVHHLDRNRDNNKEENLQTLCFNCHRITHFEINTSLKYAKPEIYEAEDGLIEVIFPKPLKDNLANYLMLVLGYRRGNMHLGDGKGKIIGFRCAKIDFEDLIKNDKTKNEF
ncbi:MAG TPA: HNH endonuclease signature motif containing protein [archaeon]|nr:HNH endonuclease signature motif containing protein [archaeon]